MKKTEKKKTAQQHKNAGKHKQSTSQSRANVGHNGGVVLWCCVVVGVLVFASDEKVCVCGVSERHNC